MAIGNVGETVGGTAIGVGLVAIPAVAVLCGTEHERVALNETLGLIPKPFATSSIGNALWNHPWATGLIIGLAICLVLMLIGAVLFPGK